ncbi:MAG TPA: PilZ domain-containing protein [Treponemataceae bacterium]|nr:PilZ domain-containing protein [Treponemataceae bacterium]
MNDPFYVAFCEVFAFQTTVSPFYFIILGVVIVVVVILKLYSKYSAKQEFHDKPHPKRAQPIVDRTPELIKTMRLNLGPDKKELRQIGLFFGFKDLQNQYIKRVCEAEKITHPGQIFSDYGKITELLESRLVKAQQSQHPTKETEAEKTIIYTIRESVENRKKQGKRITSTRMIPEKSTLSITVPEGEQYSVELVHNASMGLVCSMPLDSDGTPVRVPLWAKLSAFLTVKTNQSYKFDTRVIKYESDLSSTRIVLAQTDSIQSMPDRSHDRKRLTMPCAFSPVTVGTVSNGKKTERRFYPSHLSMDGTILDISAGGCSIQTNKPLKPGEYMEIRCILEKQTEDTMIGKTVRVQAESPDSPSVMHIQFAKMPRATMNRIFSFVYADGDHKQ